MDGDLGEGSHVRVRLEDSLPLTTRLNPRSPLLVGLGGGVGQAWLWDSLRMVLLKFSFNIVFSRRALIYALQRA